MSEVKVAFLDVGQGDSTVITLPDGTTGIVVDCYKNAVKKYIDENGITDIAYVFLTHSDYDHASQIATLLRNFPDATFLYSPDTLKLIENSNNVRILLKRLNKLIVEFGLKIESPKTGDVWQIQDVNLDILHPSTVDRFLALDRRKYGDTNSVSTVIRVTFAGKRVLLTADLNEQGWEAVVKRNIDLRADVLKFPHHGSHYETQGDHALHKLLEKINPALVILSVGTTNTYNHPHPKVIEMLDAHQKLVYRCTQATFNCFPTLATPRKPTPCSGNIEVTLSAGNLKLTTEYAPITCKRVDELSNHRL